MSSRLRFPLPLPRLALVAALAVTSAQARDATVVLHAPKPGEVQTIVTGRGRAARVALPDGPASMTPRWLVANADLHWNCPDSLAVELRVQTSTGPHATPRTVNLRPARRQGGSTRLELYLWEVAAVKAACTRDGEVWVHSVPVQLILQCEQGTEVPPPKTVALQAICQPSSPAGEDAPSKFSQLRPEPSLFSLLVGQEHTVKFPPVPRRAWAPRIQTLRLVRLGAGDQVVQRYPPIPLSEGPTFDGEEATFEPELTFTPRSAGPLRLALEAEYLDGSRRLSSPAELEVLTAKQAARRVPADKRMAFFQAVEKRMTESECGPELVVWLKQQPVIADAGQTTRSSFWYRFTDGLTGIVSCH